jgi:hypothetical protein
MQVDEGYRDCKWCSKSFNNEHLYNDKEVTDAIIYDYCSEKCKYAAYIAEGKDPNDKQGYRYFRDKSYTPYTSRKSRKISKSEMIGLGVLGVISLFILSGIYTIFVEVTTYQPEWLQKRSINGSNGSGNSEFQVYGQSRNNPSQNYSNWNFPKSECGDYNPPGLQDFYRVFVNRIDDSTLRYIKSNYCRDAYLMTITSVNRKAIQVASFRSKERALEFSQIMLKDPRIKSAEVSSPSQH